MLVEKREKEITMKRITANLEFKSPTMPNFITVSIGYPSLDEAIAKNGQTTIPVGGLDDNSIEAVIEQWSLDFKEHCLSSRKDRAEAGVK